jgi:hypothetical protein
MIEFMLVENPAHFPQTCVCGSSKGPLADTFFERGNQHIYLCKTCGKRLARLWGFAAGKNLDALEAASDERLDLERQLSEGVKLRDKLMERNAAQAKEITQLQNLISRDQDRRAQQDHLVSMIFESSKELVSTTNGGV